MSLKYLTIILLFSFFLANISCANGDKPLKLSYNKYYDKKTKCDDCVSVVTWNINYGAEFEQILKEMRIIDADIYILQEVDKYTRRTKKRDVAFEFAYALGYNFVWSEEFQELSQENNTQYFSSKAYTGQAVLSRYPVKLIREFRFKHQAARWSFHLFSIRSWPIVGQPRKGGRMAQISEVRTPLGKMIVANTHLESSVSDKKKVPQVKEVIAGARAAFPSYGLSPPVIIAGDMNTGKGAQSPIVKLLKDNGFLDVFYKLSENPFETPETTEKGKKLDWIFTNELIGVESAEVLNWTRGSNHYPVRAVLIINDFYGM